VKLLAIDTATESCSAALLINTNVRSREIEMERGHAERILPMVDELLAEAGIALNDLDAIAFGRGPGSFTGVRLATTVTQGLAFGAGLGVVPVSDLQAVAQRVLDSDDPTQARVLVCNDARMSEVYWACYERGGDGLARLEGEEHVSKPTEVKLPATWAGATVTPAGRGFIAYAEALRAAVPNATPRLPLASHPISMLTATPTPTAPQQAQAPIFFTTLTAPAALNPTASSATDPIHYLPRAIEIARLALPAVLAGRLLPPEEALPIYLRDNVAHVKQAPKPPGQGR
jgi:tRNA threonylcarbamoyladenosine biosynthesis protein TsaB